MSTVSEILTQLSTRRGERTSLDRTLVDLQARLVILNEQLDALTREGLEGSADWVTFEADKQVLETQLATGRATDASLSTEMESLKAELLQAATGGELETVIPSDVPLLLFPVRLETRFEDGGPGARRLLIRVYPDQPLIDNFEENLTAKEIEWAKDSWRQVYFDTEENLALRKALWERGLTLMSPQRAAWLARQLDPTTVSQPEGVTADTLRFPAVLQRPPGWFRSARCRVLPDRWTFIGYQGTSQSFAVHGALIPETLSVGPSPAAAVSGGGESVPLDPAIAWMVDFDAAVEAGMAVSVSISDDLFQSGIDLLLVFGVRASARPEDGKEAIEKLFRAHQYGNELAFLSPGTPTNNTETVSSGYASRTGIDHFDVNFREIESDVWSRSDGLALAQALGVDPDQFRRVDRAEKSHGWDARAMNTSLWEATWGYFLDQMMAEWFTRSQVSYGRLHFIDYVRSRGPLPTVRVGAQPYGVLPVSTFEGWVEPAPKGNASYQQFAERLVGFLKVLKPVYQASVADVPNLGAHAGESGDPDNATILTEILGMQPTSVTLQGRAVYGDDVVDGLWSCFPDPENTETETDYGGHNTWWVTQQEKVNAAITTDGVADYVSAPLRPRLAFCTLSDSPFDITQPWAQDGEGGKDAVLSTNYIEYLYEYDLSTDPDQLTSAYSAESSADLENEPLLYKLLRHSYLREYLKAGIQKLVQEGLAGERDFDEPELIVSGESETPWDVLARNINNGAGGTSALVKYCYDHRMDGVDHALVWLKEYYDGLGHLKGCTVRELEQLLRETLDLCSHRYDAWVTSFATERLQLLRAQRPGETVIGGFGWVEHLKPETRAAVQESVTGETGAGQTPLYDSTANDGYLHAPSLNQAVAGAVLLSGYLANRTDENEIDLSSRRARTALALLEGLRSGQSLEALLGYRFERALHEHVDPPLDQHIEPLRQIAPLDSTEEIYATETIETPAQGVDGAQLIEMLDEQGSELNTYLESIAANEREAIKAYIQQLSRDIDAMDDGITAESVYQLIQGNISRAGATLEAVSSGEAPPPELSVLETPRTALVHNHRVILLFTETSEGLWTGPGYDQAQRDSLRQGWTHLHRDSSPPNTLEADFMSVSEPRLNAWLGSLLGPSGAIRCEGTFSLEDGSTSRVTVTMQDLRLSPLNLLYLCGDGDAFPVDLERLIRFAMWSAREASVSTDAVLTFSVERSPEWDTELLSMREAVDLTRSLRRLILRARPLEPGDLGLGEESGEALPDDDELIDRADYLIANLAELQWELTSALAYSSTSVDDLRDVLFQAVLLAVPGAAPVSPVGDTAYDQALLAEQIKRVQKIVDARLEAATALPETQPEARIRAVLGGQFMVLATFTPGNSEEFAQAMAINGGLDVTDHHTIPEWLMRVGRVHPELANLYETFSFLEAIGRINPFEQCRVIQLPWIGADDVWIGKEVTEANSDRSRLSILACVPGDSPIPPGTTPVSGLMVDSWSDVVPALQETTGVAFHFNRPNAQAPQSMLIAVAPSQTTASWSRSVLEQILKDTLELARLRTVDPDALKELGQYLPAMYLASNLESDTVATDFTSPENPRGKRRRRWS